MSKTKDIYFTITNSSENEFTISGNLVMHEMTEINTGTIKLKALDGSWEAEIYIWEYYRDDDAKIHSTVMIMPLSEAAPFDPETRITFGPAEVDEIIQLTKDPNLFLTISEKPMVKVNYRFRWIDVNLTIEQEQKIIEHINKALTLYGDEGKIIDYNSTTTGTFELLIEYDHQGFENMDSVIDEHIYGRYYAKGLEEKFEDYSKYYIDLLPHDKLQPPQLEK